MASPDPDAPIEVRAEWDAALESFLADRIYEFNSRTTGLNDGKGIVGAIRDDAQRIIAAVCGHTWGGTCQVTYLWVDEAHRGRGYARALLDAFVEEARHRRVHRIWLASYDFQAPAMYEKAGFERMAEFEGWPEGHVNAVFCKTL